MRPFFILLGGVFIEKVRYKNIKDWFPIKNIKDNVIYLKDGSNVKIFRVEPINFKLKSDMEKRAILESYKQFLKLCNFDMQIIIQTDNVDIEKHFLKIDAFQKDNLELSEMAEDYKNLIKSITNKRDSISRKFYIVARDKNKNVKDKIISGLLNCGNSVAECSKLETINIIKRYFRKNSGARKEAKWV